MGCPSTCINFVLVSSVQGFCVRHPIPSLSSLLGPLSPVPHFWPSFPLSHPLVSPRRFPSFSPPLFTFPSLACSRGCFLSWPSRRVRRPHVVVGAEPVVVVAVWLLLTIQVLVVLLLVVAVGVVVDVAVLHLLEVVADRSFVRRHLNRALHRLGSVTHKWLPVTRLRRHCCCARLRLPASRAPSLVGIRVAARRRETGPGQGLRGLPLHAAAPASQGPQAILANLLRAVALPNPAADRARHVPAAALGSQVLAVALASLVPTRTQPSLLPTVAARKAAVWNVRQGLLPLTLHLLSSRLTIVRRGPCARLVCRSRRPRNRWPRLQALPRGLRRLLLRHRGGHLLPLLRHRAACRRRTGTCRSLYVGSSSPLAHRGLLFPRRGHLLLRRSDLRGSTR